MNKDQIVNSAVGSIAGTFVAMTAMSILGKSISGYLEKRKVKKMQKKEENKEQQKEQQK